MHITFGLKLNFLLYDKKYTTCIPIFTYFNLDVSGSIGQLESPPGTNDVIEIMKDGIYEISVSFIFQSVDGKRVWANLMRKKYVINEKDEGKNFQTKYYVGSMLTVMLII